MLVEESMKESVVILRGMIKELVNKVDEIIETMELTHAKEILNLITIKKSYDRKVVQLGRKTVDMIIKTSQENHKKKIMNEHNATVC